MTHVLMGPKTFQSFLCVREEAVGSTISAFGSSPGSLNMNDILIRFTMEIMCKATLGKSYSEAS